MLCAPIDRFRRLPSTDYARRPHKNHHRTCGVTGSGLVWQHQDIFLDSALGLSREDTTSYTRDSGGLLLSMRTGTGNYYYLPDGLGSVASVTDAAGNLVATYNYEPFGKLKSSTGTLPNPYRWLGALGVYHDSATGLYKMGTRYYDPALGRFTQVDPVKAEPLPPTTTWRRIRLTL